MGTWIETTATARSRPPFLALLLFYYARQQQLCYRTIFIYLTYCEFAFFPLVSQLESAINRTITDGRRIALSARAVDCIIFSPLRGAVINFYDPAAKQSFTTVFLPCNCRCFTIVSILFAFSCEAARNNSPCVVNRFWMLLSWITRNCKQNTRFFSFSLANTRWREENCDGFFNRSLRFEIF